MIGDAELKALDNKLHRAQVRVGRTTIYPADATKLRALIAEVRRGREKPQADRDSDTWRDERPRGTWDKLCRPYGHESYIRSDGSVFCRNCGAEQP